MPTTRTIVVDVQPGQTIRYIKPNGRRTLHMRVESIHQTKPGWYLLGGVTVAANGEERPDLPGRSLYAHGDHPVTITTEGE